MFNVFVNVYTFHMSTSTAPTKTRRVAPKRAKTADDPRQLRHQALADVRRELVLDAARSAFFELGMEKASIREIAHRAGYTPGAIYSYFASKEELYGTLLSESLDRLNERVQETLDKKSPGPARARATAKAIFDFYRENPRDLDLGFYLFQGMQPFWNCELNPCLWLWMSFRDITLPTDLIDTSKPNLSFSIPTSSARDRPCACCRRKSSSSSV